MKVVHGLEGVDPRSWEISSVLTIGNFDGVHRAHQKLLARAGELAAAQGLPVVVLTFDPHPLTVVAPGKAPVPLSSLQQKLDFLREASVDVTVVARSEPQLLGLEAEDFVEHVVVRRFRPSHVVEGPSFGFGRGRKGNAELLCDLGRRLGFQVHVVEPVTVTFDDGQPCAMVSSSLIRRLLAEGRVHHAAICLGRTYGLMGEVVVGDRRGTVLGFPTANVQVGLQLVPAEGVYAGRATIAGRTFPAAISIGPAATFGGMQARVEAHVLDFHGDLYGQSIRIDFEQYLRGQQAFSSPNELVAQIGRDVQAVRRLVGASAGKACESKTLNA